MKGTEKLNVELDWKTAFKKQRWSCTACGFCCKIFDVALIKKDIAKLMQNGKDDAIIFKKKLGISLKKKKGGHCSFLKGKKCEIQKFKPSVCLVFPFNVEIAINGELRLMINRSCPFVGEGPKIDTRITKEKIGEILEQNPQYYSEWSFFNKINYDLNLKRSLSMYNGLENIERILDRKIKKVSIKTESPLDFFNSVLNSNIEFDIERRIIERINHIGYSYQINNDLTLQKNKINLGENWIVFNGQRIPKEKIEDIKIGKKYRKQIMDYLDEVLYRGSTSQLLFNQVAQRNPLETIAMKIAVNFGIINKLCKISALQGSREECIDRDVKNALFACDFTN